MTWHNYDLLISLHSPGRPLFADCITPNSVFIFSGAFRGIFQRKKGNSTLCLAEKNLFKTHSFI